MNQAKGVVDLVSGIKKKIAKEKVGQYTKIENFILHLQLRKCNWNKGSGEKDELSRFIEKGKKIVKEREYSMEGVKE